MPYVTRNEKIRFLSEQFYEKDRVQQSTPLASTRFEML